MVELKWPLAFTFQMPYDDCTALNTNIHIMVDRWYMPVAPVASFERSGGYLFFLKVRPLMQYSGCIHLNGP
jgi:hypothetical protein